MKPNPISLIAFAFILPLFSLAQAPSSPKLFLRTGTVEPVPNITQDKLDALQGKTSRLQLRLIDHSGKIIKQFNRTGSGFLQKIPIDLQGVPAGLYSLELSQGSEKRYFRLLRQ